MRRLLATIALGCLLVTGCSSSETSGGTTPDTTGATLTSSETTPPETTSTETASTETASTESPAAGIAFANRPFTVEVPKSHDPATPAALLIVLHGYTSSGANMRGYFNLQSLAEERGFLAVYPNGTTDVRGNPFWNATNACCNFASSDVDDSGYLMHIIDTAKSRYLVDPKRVYLLGHSNGGFMSYRMACEHADTIAAIVSLAGATFDDPSLCKPAEPVSILQIHGTADEVIGYNGGQILSDPFPSALKTVTTWAGYNGCVVTPLVPANARSLDLDANIAGNDTGTTTFSGCKPGGAVELRSIDGGIHSPNLSANFPTTVLDFLDAHAKP